MLSVQLCNISSNTIIHCFILVCTIINLYYAQCQSEKSWEHSGHLMLY